MAQTAVPTAATRKIRGATRKSAAARVESNSAQPKGPSRTSRSIERAGWLLLGGGLAVGAAGALASGTGVGAVVGVPAVIGGVSTAFVGAAMVMAAGPVGKAWDSIFGKRK